MSKQEADLHAQAEYEQFAARRRALLEAEGEKANNTMFEEASKELPAPKLVDKQ